MPGVLIKKIWTWGYIVGRRSCQGGSSEWSDVAVTKDRWTPLKLGKGEDFPKVMDYLLRRLRMIQAFNQGGS